MSAFCPGVKGELAFSNEPVSAMVNATQSRLTLRPVWRISRTASPVLTYV